MLPLGLAEVCGCGIFLLDGADLLPLPGRISLLDRQGIGEHGVEEGVLPVLCVTQVGAVEKIV